MPKWLPAEDVDGYPALRCPLGPYNVYLTGSYEGNGRVNWFRLEVYHANAFENPNVMAKFQTPVYENWNLNILTPSNITEAVEIVAKPIIQAFVESERLRMEQDIKAMDAALA